MLICGTGNIKGIKLIGIATVGTYRQIPAGLCGYIYIDDSYTVSYSTEIAIFVLVSMHAVTDLSV